MIAETHMPSNQERGMLENLRFAERKRATTVCFWPIAAHRDKQLLAYPP
jgi:hypothetical protein